MKKWQGSNSSDLMMFMDSFCEKCAKMPISADAEGQCSIQLRMMAYGVKDKEYPKQIVEDDNGFGMCTSFVSRITVNARRKGSGPGLDPMQFTLKVEGNEFT